MHIAKPPTKAPRRLAGYDPGPADGTLNPQTAAALDKYRASKGHLLNEDGLRKTLSSLAVDVAAAHPNDKAALQVAVDLITVVSTPATGSGTVAPAVPQPRSSDCEDGHWVQSVSSGGEIVKLEDGSLWEISAIDRIDTTLWLVTEEITVCGDRLINTDTGDAVDATRLK